MINNFTINEMEYFRDIYINIDNKEINIKRIYPRYYNFQSNIEKENPNYRLVFFMNENKNFEEQVSVFFKLRDGRIVYKGCRIGFSLMNETSLRILYLYRKDILKDMINIFSFKNMPLPILKNTDAHINLLFEKIDRAISFMNSATYLGRHFAKIKDEEEVNEAKF